MTKHGNPLRFVAVATLALMSNPTITLAYPLAILHFSTHKFVFVVDPLFRTGKHSS